MVQCVVSVVPRGFGGSVDGCVDGVVDVFSGVWDGLADDGVVWLLVDDVVGGSGVSGLPWRVGLGLQRWGWWLRQDVVLAGGGSGDGVGVCVRSHRYLFLLSKARDYFFDGLAISEPAKTKPGATWLERKAAGATAGNVIGGDGRRNGTQRVVHGKGVSSNLTRQDGLRNRRSVWFLDEGGVGFSSGVADLCVRSGSRVGDSVWDVFGVGDVEGVVVGLGRRFVSGF